MKGGAVVDPDSELDDVGHVLKVCDSHFVRATMSEVVTLTIC